MIYREESTTNSNCCVILRDNHLTSPRHGTRAFCRRRSFRRRGASTALGGEATKLVTTDQLKRVFFV